MLNKKQIQNIKTNIERTIQGLRTKPQEFIYDKTKGFVRPGMVYSVYYTLSKKEVYLTGIKDTSNSKVIKKVNNKNSDIFEISKDDFEDQNNLYKYTSFRWRISGKREEVIRDNRRTIRIQEIDYPGISKILSPLQLWKPPKNSTESLQKKLLLLKFD